MYCFDEVINRRGTGSLKWDVAENELPMWVADMDFKTAPEVEQAIMERAMHGIFGYGIVTEEWQNAIIGWWQRRHHFTIEADWLIFATGVVPAISSIVRKMTSVGEKILVQPPVYNIFYNSIVNNGRYPVENKLIYDGEGHYQIDFEDLEEKLSDPQVSMMILCNPHNPVGKIWDRETLARIGELCDQYHVLVLSDEIHCDIIEPGKEYIPFASVSEICKNNCITCVAPTKTFNIAGLQTAAVFVPNKWIRHKVWRGLNTDEVAEPNAFAITATVAAFTKGEAWLEELRSYLWENRRIAEEYLAAEWNELKPVKAEATYLMWLDCSAVTQNVEVFAAALREKTGLYVCEGTEYHNGEGFLRINLACPRTTLMDGLKRLVSFRDENK
ncbi:MAG: MalY/PatB family protein [Lachnospiraceae bacterium]